MRQGENSGDWDASAGDADSLPHGPGPGKSAAGESGRLLRGNCSSTSGNVNSGFPLVVVMMKGTCRLVLGAVLFFMASVLVGGVSGEIGGLISVPLVLERTSSPYFIREDVIIDHTGELVIRPGVQLYFSPTVGITVFGRLIAEGTPTQRIVMTSATLKIPASTLNERLNDSTHHQVPAFDDNMLHPSARLEYSTGPQYNYPHPMNKRALGDFQRGSDRSDPPSVRLMEGPTPLIGRVQVYHRGQWRSVCTNSRNWTISDMQTVCREMGFTGGEFWNWMDHLNDTKQMLWERPTCQGLESHLKDCSNWQGRQLGSGVCDHHPNLGIRCDTFHRFPGKVEQHWRGIRFENAKHRETYIHDNTLRVKESLSFLKHVDIFYAGVGLAYNASSAVESLGVPPVISDVRIEYSAYNGINVTNPGSIVGITNSTIRNNAGFGIYVNSSWSGCQLDTVTLESNGNDGMRFLFHDAIPDQKLDGVEVFDLCTVPVTLNQIYPIRLFLDQNENSLLRKECRKRFQVRSGYVLTMHFPYSMSKVDHAAEISVYDGPDSRGNLLTTIRVKNETFPQSVTSTRETIYLEFKANPSTRLLFYVDLFAGKGKDYDLKLTNSILGQNNGRGLAVENMRSQVIVHSSSIKENSHISGIHILGGVGHVNISRTEIMSNIGDGVNITYGGGSRNVSRSLLAANTRRGFAVWFNSSSVKLPSEQETVVEYTEISRNLETGIFVGNFCGPGVVNISGNVVKDSKQPGVEVWSCWTKIDSFSYGYPLKLQIGHNRFINNDHFGIKLVPLLNAVAMIEHNYFSLQAQKGCLVIQGVDWKELETLPANVEVSNNVFEKNTGVFVASLGLNHNAPRQKMIFTQNFVRWNTITEPYSSQLNPRSRVAAPVVISSSNVEVYRNIIQNPDSKYEIGSHMTDQSFALNCTYNWLGSKDEKDIYYRVFDRKDRFNLARINFIPFILSPTDPNTEIAMTMTLFVPTFDSPDRVIGGEITGRESLNHGEYKVVRDISVRPGGQLQIAFGVTLKFLPSVGIMVGGQFHAEGFAHAEGSNVRFTLFDTGRINSTDAPVRLVGGRTRKDGRLQVRIGNTWGSVCNYGFDVEDAAVACRQMGFVLNADDWMLERVEIPQASPSEQILMSNIDCTEWDNDLIGCEAEMAEDIENSCPHDNVVGIKCYDTSWAGIRMAITAEKSVIKYAVVEKAGLLDPHTNEHKPALQLDFSHHVLSDISVSDNTGDGLGIIYSDLYFPDTVNIVERSEFKRNLGNGVLLRQLGLELRDCVIEHNRGAGILHDPTITREHQREIAGWVSVGKKDRIEYLPLPSKDLFLDENNYKYIISTSKSPNVNEVYNIFAQDQNFVLSLQLLNPIHNDSTEELVIYDRHDIPAKEGTEFFHDLESWSVRRDQVSFPTSSSSYGITLWYRSGPRPRGNLILLIRVIRAPISRYARSRLLEGPLPKLKVIDTKLRYNGRGIAAIHYNRYENEDGDLFLRKSNESMELLRSDLSFNRGEAFHVFTPFREIYSSNISEITFMINDTIISDNTKGLVQYSKDLRSSNNLYHWILRDNVVERNKEGGFQISLPYVWQYDENHTHSVHFENVTFRNNENFETVIDGHYAQLHVLGCLFENNVCRGDEVGGVFSVTGMEKQMLIFNNQFLNNQGSFAVQFDTDSQSEIVGSVFAYFVRNQIKHNRIHPRLRNSRYGSRSTINNATYQPSSYALGLKGHQKVNVTKNLFGDNTLDYELLAGTKTAKLDNYVNVVQNWWGTSDPRRIRERIFDFDDWNSYAIASYRPYLLRDDFEAPFSTTFEPENEVTIDNLGGRLLHPLILYKRARPYIIKADLTIMPNAMLTIGPGVEMEFYPSVGILALGPLIAQGLPEAPIVMKPIMVKKMEELERGRNYGDDSIHKEKGVRLCAEEKCEPGVNQGFLEYFNKTTLQWVPMCDNRFTERNVQVVCKQLGFDDMNLYFDYGKRWEYQYNHVPVSRVRKWPEPFQCVGNEKSLDDCPIRMNGQLYGYDYPCHWEDDFIFIHCGNRNLNRTMEYWGGIRFSVPDFEQHLFEDRMHDAVTHNSFTKEESVLEWVEIYGAGVLHNEKSPAVLSIMQSPLIRYVNITKSASHAISLISAPKTMRMSKNYIVDNMGLGFSGLSLLGESQQSDSSSFYPLKKIEIPYGIFGMVDVCDTNKEIIVEERVVLYYKYDNFPVDCVKIFKSVYNAKNLGFRLLQFNLFNSTGKPWPPDYIKLIDGDIYNITTEEIATLTMGDESNGLNKFYSTSWPSLSVKVHATGATEYHGFVAEILTLPVSPHGIERNVQHNITFTIFQNNSRGAVYYGSAGEISPTVTLEKNRIEDNCHAFYGNFSSCESAVRFDVQNMQHIYFMNNVVRRNQGGLSITSDSSGSPTAMKAYVHNNLFENNTNREVLHVEGKRSSPFQEIVFYRNIVTRNDCNFANVITLSQVVSNLTENFIHANRGNYIMEVSGFEKVRLPIYQSCTHNSFFMNVAIDHEDKTTIVAASTGQQYIDNILVNPENSYELVAVNKSRPRALQGYDWSSAVDARHNWWGYPGTIAVMGRIKDENDNIDLLRVLFDPYRVDNKTLLSGKCPPGYTLVAETCYMYVGGHMTFQEAKDFCRNENASMPYVEANYYSVIHFLRMWQEDYDYYDRVWVQDVDRFGQCTTFVANSVQEEECSYRLPFICETDPKIRIDPLAWTADSVIVGALVSVFIAFILIVFILVFWYTKSKQRQVERLERRNSVRASIRSSRSLTSMGSLSEVGYRRRVAEIVSSQKSLNTTSASAGNLNYNNKMNGSFDSIEKNPSAFTSLDNTSYDDYYETQSQSQTPRTGVSQASSLFDGAGAEVSRHPMGGGGGIGRPRPRPENGIHGLPIVPPQAPRTTGPTSHRFNVQADVLQKPSFDLTYHNQNFRETPSMPSISHPSNNNNDFWGQPSQQTKPRHGGVEVFPRTSSMATTMPLHHNASGSTDPLTDTEPSPRSEIFPRHHHPLSVHHPHPHHSYEGLDLDRVNQNNRGGDSGGGSSVRATPEYVPNIFPDSHHQHHRPLSMPPTAFSNLNNNNANRNNETPSQMSHKELKKPGGGIKRPLGSGSDSSGEEEYDAPRDITPFISQPESPASSSDDKNQSGSRKGRIIETSLDDLEVDYELEETIRPVSTFLETDVDVGEIHPPLRGAQSQYIPSSQPSSSQQTGSSHHPTHPQDDFKALSSRSKSMPLETEM